MAKTLKKLLTLSTTTTLFEIDSNNDFMPVETYPEYMVSDENGDITTPIVTDIEDNEFELDENYDIMPKE